MKPLFGQNTTNTLTSLASSTSSSNSRQCFIRNFFEYNNQAENFFLSSSKLTNICCPKRQCSQRKQQVDIVEQFNKQCSPGRIRPHRNHPTHIAIIAVIRLFPNGLITILLLFHMLIILLIHLFVIQLVHKPQTQQTVEAQEEGRQTWHGTRHRGHSRT